MTRNATDRRAPAALLGLALCANAPAATLNATWTFAGNGDWTNAANWDSVAFPDNGADTYDVFVTTNVTVTHDTGSALTIDNLTVDKGNTVRFEEPGSSLSVLNASTISGKVVAADGASVDLGGGTLSDAGLEAIETIGGLPNAMLTSTATSYAGSLSGSADRTLKADGAGTMLDLSSLTSFVRPTSQFADITVSAVDGGTVDLSSLTAFTPNGGANQSHLNVTANGGTIDLSLVTSIADGVHYKAVNGGTILGALTSATNASLTKGGSGSVLDFSSLTTVVGSTVTAEDGGVVVLGAGTNIDDTGLKARKTAGGTDNAMLTSHATSWSGSTSGTTDRTLEADGAGTVLDLSSLTSFVRPTSQFADVTIRAVDGGTVDLSSLTSFTPSGGATQSSLNVTANGGTIDLSLVTSVAERVHYKAVNGGTILGALTSATNASLTKGGSGSVLDFSSLTTVAGSTVTAEDGGVVVLGAGTNIDDTGLKARKTAGGTDNAMLTSHATSWSGSTSGTTDRTLEADGAGTVLDLSSLTSFVRPTNRFADVTIRAVDGGTVDLSSLTSFTPSGGATQSSLNVTANGGTIDLSLVTSIADGVHYKAVDGGTILGALTSATNASLTKGGSGSVLDFSSLTTVAGSTVTAEDGGVVVLGAGTNIDDTGLRARKTAGGTDNAMLTSHATSWSGSTSGTTDRTLEADGAGTVLDLSSLTSFVRPTSQFADVTIRAVDGGTVDLSSLTSFTPSGGATQSSLNVTANGGTIDLSLVTAIGDGVHYKAVNGGTILGALTSATNASLTKGGSGSVLDFSSLTTVAGSTVTAEDGGMVVLGAGTNIDDTGLKARKTAGGTDNAMLTSHATSWSGSTSGTTDRTLEADGAGTVLDLSSLTSFVRPTSQFAGVTIRAKDGGLVDLSSLTSFTPNGGATQSNLNLTSRDAGSHVDLSALTALADGNLTVDDLGTLDVGSLASLSGGTLTLDDSAAAVDVAVASGFTLGDDGVVDTNGATSALVIGTAGAVTAGAVNVLADGSLGGTGTVIGDLVSLGEVAPGNSPGTLTVDGNYAQDAGATLAIEIASLSEFDVLDVSGSAALDGTLSVAFTGYTPNAGDEFVFLLAALGLGGTTFANVPASVGGYFVDVVYAPTSATLVVGAPVPLPAGVWLMLAGLGGLATCARRKRA